MGKIPTRDNFFIMSTGVYSCFQRSRPALNHQSLTTACGFDRADTGLKKFQLEISFTLILVWVCVGIIVDRHAVYFHYISFAVYV